MWTSAMVGFSFHVCGGYHNDLQKLIVTETFTNSSCTKIRICIWFATLNGSQLYWVNIIVTMPTILSQDQRRCIYPTLLYYLSIMLLDHTLWHLCNSYQECQQPVADYPFLQYIRNHTTIRFNMESEHKPLRSMCGLETLIPASLIPRTPSTTVYACRQADLARLLNLKHRVESAWQNHFHNLLDNRVETTNPCAICRDWSWSTIFPGSWRKKLSTLYICPQKLWVSILRFGLWASSTAWY